MPKLSIITINLNNRDGLKKTIDSVIAQTFKDFEWIVIDGGSTDGSRELIEQYADHFAYWVSEPDKGIYNAMNKGIRMAQGEYLQFLNSGDWLYNDKVLHYVFSRSDNDDIVYGDYQFYIGNRLLSNETTPDHLRFSYLVNHWLGHSASFIRRELFDDTPYDENLRIASDWKFFIQQALLGRTFHHVSCIVSCQDDTGISVVEQELVQQERSRILDSLVPKCIYNDIVENNRIFSDKKLMEIKHFKDSMWLYRKMINLSLRFMKTIEKHRSK